MMRSCCPLSCGVNAGQEPPLWAVGVAVALVQRAVGLQQRWGLGFHDALVVAGALAAGCTRLLTEDLQHGQRIETLTVENPFR